jgi:hypothetical protein
MRPERDDLFDLFPDLPWPSRPARDAHALQLGIDQWRRRAMAIVERQREAAAAVKKKLSARRGVTRGRAR